MHINTTLIIAGLFLGISSIHLSAQSTKPTSIETNIDKWNRAIINVETRSSNAEVISALTQKMWNHEISQEEYEKTYRDLYITPSGWGTVIFLLHNNRHYLLTARHVVEDKYAQPAENRISSKVLLVKNGSPSDSIGVNKEIFDKEYLMNISIGVPYMRPYEFSSLEDDTAIICLENLRFPDGKNFVNLLKKKGYQPITTTDIDFNCHLTKGQEITSFGFPKDFFPLDRRNVHKSEIYWKSDYISVPVVSYGAVVDSQEDEHFFSGGIFVTNGNSGGPIVSQDKLIGIVSNQQSPIKMISGNSLNYYYDRSIFFVKSSFVVGLLTKLEERMIGVDKEYRERYK